MNPNISLIANLTQQTIVVLPKMEDFPREKQQELIRTLTELLLRQIEDLRLKSPAFNQEG